MKYFAKTLFNGQTLLNDQVVTTKNGSVTSVQSGTAEQADTRIDGLLTPAYIDVQVNGGGGSLFNNEPTYAALQRITQAHLKFGTGSLLPTLITDNLDTMQQAADAIAQAIANKLPGVIGVHFEGPHLSVPRRGIHPSEHIRDISEEEMRIFLRKDLGRVCVTVAPENVSPSTIKTLVSHNVIVCLGHSNATDKQTFDALASGATGFTHLFNAMSPLQSRASGVVGAALLSNDTYCGLIVDNEHVSITSCQLAIKCKGPQEIMLVTDAMSHVGSEQNVLPFAGMDITRTGNKLTLENGTLAGSALDMQRAVQNAVELLNCSVIDALTMASTTPAAFLGLQHSKGCIAPGFDVEWIVLNDKLEVTQFIHQAH
ncbi:MAG: N-acetylglucosamine-6-phosphate deacetylase [Glaciecola sp.]